jgi:hypothetical protein
MRVAESARRGDLKSDFPGEMKLSKPVCNRELEPSFLRPSANKKGQSYQKQLPFSIGKWN